MNSRIPIGDYSLLMDSIEGKLDSYVNRHSQNSSSNNTSADISILNNNTRIFSPTSRMPTTSKRRNVEYSSTDTPINYSSSIPIQDFNLSTGKKLRLAVESDELRIQNEQLIEKMERVESEHGRTKEKLERQLGFLDSENNELRAALNRSNDKYFEEKKNWQTKIRSLEADIASIKKQQSQELVSTKDQHRSTRVTPSSNDDKLLSQIQNLEIQLLQKSEEVKHLMKARAKSEEKVSKLQQDLIMARMNSAGDDAGFESVADEDDGDTLMRGQPNKSATIRIRELERKCNDLESSLRKKSQELEKYTSKYENQAILTDENLNLKNKLQLAQGRINELQSIEGKFLSLNHEKEHWSAIIKEVIPSSHTLLGSEHDGIVGSGNGDIGPTGVLRMLAATQKKCATVCQNEGKLETQVRELKRSLSTMQSQMKSLEDSKAKLTEQYESATKSSARLQQEVKSYENEVNSLRDLMRTYDTEFSIGRRAEAASTSSVVAEKEKVIASLRSELDLSRESCASLRVTINKTEQYVNDLQAQVSRLEEESKSIKNSARSTVDLDYDPKVTKVLHLMQNPSVTSTKGLGEAVSNALATSAIDTTATGADGIDTSKLHQRLKEAFKERVTAFREAVYLLTGYKVDLLPGSEGGSGGSVSSKLRLRSMYAESQDDFLLFQLKGTAVELLDTPFASKLDQRHLVYLTSCNSVPCFLSSVTMDLFDNQTFC